MSLKGIEQTQKHVENRVKSFEKNGKTLNMYRGKKILIGDKKFCSKCNLWKSISEYDKDFSSKIGLRANCKSCQLVYRSLHREQIRLTQYKSDAKKRGIEFRLSKDEFLTFWQKPCTYCGDDVKEVGLDRIDSNKGYFIDNVVSCCGICNVMKLALPREIFIQHCYKVIKHQNYRSES